MKRAKLLKQLRKHGCHLLREGGRHSVWMNPATNVKEAIPRHNEIKTRLAHKICANLGVEPPKEA